jgi:hypothetical protein
MKAFEQISERVGRHLALFGYSAKERETGGPFGSSYTDWEGLGTRFRLIWDGKDQWFILQGQASSSAPWEDLEVTSRESVQDEAESQVLAALNRALASGHPDRPAFPLRVLWGDGSVDVIQDATEAELNLEWLDSNSPDGGLRVEDAAGRPVRLVVTSLEIRDCELQ